MIPRCAALKATMDRNSMLQRYDVLGFQSEENMGEFLDFLGQHIAFTEEYIHFTMLVGDVVEQAIRLTNSNQYQKNAQKDVNAFKKERERIRKVKFEKYLQE